MLRPLELLRSCNEPIEARELCDHDFQSLLLGLMLSDFPTKPDIYVADALHTLAAMGYVEMSNGKGPISLETITDYTLNYKVCLTETGRHVAGAVPRLPEGGNSELMFWRGTSATFELMPVLERLCHGCDGIIWQGDHKDSKPFTERTIAKTYSFSSDPTAPSPGTVHAVNEYIRAGLLQQLPNRKLGITEAGHEFSAAVVAAEEKIFSKQPWLQRPLMRWNRERILQALEERRLVC